MRYHRTLMGGRRTPIHPLLFAVFPILSLFAQNRHILSAGDIVEPLAIALAGSAALWVLLGALCRDRRRAAAATSWILLVFYSFSALQSAMSFAQPPSPAVSLAIWTAVLLAGVAAIFASRHDWSPLTQVLNIVAVVAVAMPLAAAYASHDGTQSASARPRTSEPARAATNAEETSMTFDATSERPDVYYIVLDAYARDDVLHRYYDLDNGAFIAALEQRGFYVARQSRSNYGQTYLSLASSLNSTYLDAVAERVGPEATDRAPLREMISRSRAATYLRRRGYTFVAFSSGYTGTEIPDADVYLEPRAALSEFEQTLLESTPLVALSDSVGSEDVRYQAHRNRILFTLGRLGAAGDWRGPAFVFAHVFAPHPPFVFEADGKPARHDVPFSTRDGGPFPDGGRMYVRGYREQVRFLNGRVIEAIDRILKNSARPPIIVLQGDHGPGSCWEQTDLGQSDPRERVSILNAYYFPDRRYEQLYQDITPVNTFRVIFQQYFGNRDALLEDRSYLSTWTHPYRFVDVTAQVGNEQSS